MTTINYTDFAYHVVMSQATVVGPDDGKLVVTKDDECWPEGEILIATDTWVEVDGIR